MPANKNKYTMKFLTLPHSVAQYPDNFLKYQDQGQESPCWAAVVIASIANNTLVLGSQATCSSVPRNFLKSQDQGQESPCWAFVIIASIPNFCSLQQERSSAPRKHPEQSGPGAGKPLLGCFHHCQRLVKALATKTFT